MLESKITLNALKYRPRYFLRGKINRAFKNRTPLTTNPLKKHKLFYEHKKIVIFSIVVSFKCNNRISSKQNIMTSGDFVSIDIIYLYSLHLHCFKWLVIESILYTYSIHIYTPPTAPNFPKKYCYSCSTSY